MNEEAAVVEIDSVEEVKKRLAEIREQFEKKRKHLRRSQETEGVVQEINGGFTFRLGNEVEDFEKVFGLPA